LGFISAIVFSLIGFGLLFAVDRTADSAKGLFFIFAFTGVEGLALAPLVAHFLATPNGGLVVTQALAATSLVSFVLSAYAIKSGKDFSYMRGFLLTGLIVMLVAGIANIFLHMPALQLAIAAGGAIIASGLILFDTSRIINGGETNYIRATLALFLDIKLLFVSLLQLLGAANDD
jgi:modulator of FtsH protease